MTEFEKIERIKTVLAVSAAEAICYPTWDDKFARENIKRDEGRILEGIGRVDATTLTREQAVTLGFNRWDEESGIYLLPMYLYPFLAYGQTLTSISGAVKVVQEGYTEAPHKGGYLDRYIDNDHRGGSLAYGFVPAA